MIPEGTVRRHRGLRQKCLKLRVKVFDYVEEGEGENREEMDGGLRSRKWTTGMIDWEGEAGGRGGYGLWGDGQISCLQS